MPNPDYNTT